MLRSNGYKQSISSDKSDLDPREVTYICVGHEDMFLSSIRSIKFRFAEKMLNREIGKQ